MRALTTLKEPWGAFLALPRPERLRGLNLAEDP